MGDGAFLRALALEAERQRRSAEVWGVEMATDTFASTVASGVIDPTRAIRSDFLAVKPFNVQAVVGNPPYVRLRHIPADQAKRARAVAEDVLGDAMDPSGSIWMPFVLHATRFLEPGGRLGLVLPYDLTYVRYARPLWAFLGRAFGNLQVIRVHERMFPEILQETVLLLADDYGSRTPEIRFDAYETVAQLDSGRPVVASSVQVEDVCRGERAFLEALLTEDAQGLLRTRIHPATIPARDLVTFNIGYVCGDKGFFHPSGETIEEYRLRPRSLRSSLTSARQLRGVGLRTSSLPESRFSQLFLPDALLADGERDYVRYGETIGVADRYKCRIRDPWYVTPSVKTPDVLLPVFTEKPALLVNDAEVAASNSLLCGYLRQTTAEALAASWFTTLTLLQIELQVHSLGGGVMVLVPREAGSIRLPRVDAADSSHLEDLHDLLTQEKVDLAFASGDEPILRGTLGLNSGEIALIQEAVETLGHWRTSARPSSPVASSGEDIHEEQTVLEGLDHAIDEGVDMEVAVRD